MTTPFSKHLESNLEHRGGIARSRRALALFVLFLTLISGAAFAQSTPFTERFATNDFGDVLIIGNTLMTCPAADADCADAQAGIGTVNNQSYSMVYVDVDADGTTFNSSSADLALPIGTEVLFAGLYWGGLSDSATRNEVRFATPASGGYLDLTGAVLGSTGVDDYAAFIDVTAQVQAGGAGTYTVADVEAETGGNRYAGWALVVAARIPGEPPRNLSVFDGYQVISGADVTIDVSGFETPPSGPVLTTIGAVSFEGDLGITGDGTSLEGMALSDANNPTTNFFNSTISDLGTTVTSKNPDYVNQLGFDADRVSADGILGNSVSMATLLLDTSGDFYYPTAVTFAIELFAPELTVVKSMTDQNGGDLVPGDVIEVVLTVTNDGMDTADDVVLSDPIPANTAFVPGSLEIVSGANAGVKTDVSGDDQAEVAAGDVVFRLGTGATSAAGGSLAAAASTQVRFELTVDAATPPGTTLTNQAAADFTASTLGSALSTSSNEPTLTVASALADLSVVKTASQNPVTAGSLLSYVIDVVNNGPSTATDVVVTDTLPPETPLQSTDGTGWSCTAAGQTVSCSLPSLPPGPAAPLRLIVETSGIEGMIQNTVAVSAAEPDPNPGNDSWLEETTVRSVVDVPALGFEGLLLLISGLAAAAFWILKRQGS